MITLLQLVVLGSEAWASRFWRLPFVQNFYVWDEPWPPVFCTNAGAHLTNGGMR